MLREEVSQLLQVPVEKIDSIARSASHLYKRYTVPKRTGGERVIHHPSQELKAVQRALNDFILQEWPVHRAAMAYRPGVGIRQNAEAHMASRYLLRMDLQSFFPSISADDLDAYFRVHPDRIVGWTPKDTEFFKAIVCLRGQLTIGSPSSPMLSNAIMWDIDSALSELCEEQAVVFTRYADDLFFSSGQPNVLSTLELRVTGLITEATLPRSLRINPQKTHHSSRRHRRVVTGVVLRSDGGISVGRSLKREVRSLTYRHADLSLEERKRLAGLLAFIKSVEPRYLNRLTIKFGPQRVRNAMRPPTSDLDAPSEL